MTEKDLEIQNLRRYLRLANAALKTATANVDEATKNVKWARDKLMEAENQNRALRTALVAAHELPPPADVERIASKLEKSRGMIGQDAADEAAALIRRLWRNCNANS